MIDPREPQAVLDSIRAECTHRLRSILECRQDLQSRGVLSLTTLRECVSDYSFSIPRAASLGELTDSSASLSGTAVGDYFVHPIFFASPRDIPPDAVILESRPHRVVNSGRYEYEVVARVWASGEIRIDLERRN